jgi:hypothetical protein
MDSNKRCPTLVPYMAAIANKIGADSADVRLFRKVDNKELSAFSFNDAYIKPDAGYGSKLSPYIITVDTNEGRIIVAKFSLYEFPSCCAFCVSTGAYTEPAFRNKGVNKIANKLRQRIAKEYGYAALICTDVESNVAERKTLIRNGFKDIYRTINGRTGNVVVISVKHLWSC